ncbi:MAG: ABC transporter ATP-binding protein [Planctomycetota bacterium]
MAGPIVELEGVEKDYGIGGGALTVLFDINLTIGPGEFVAIVGPSGSGKSTLMNILGCLDRCTRGQYRLAGTDVSRLNDDQLSRVRNREIGFVFQSFHLVPQLTVLENVEVPLFYSGGPRRERRPRCLKQLEEVGLSHRLTHYPTQLSGGECQRVAIARALVNRPAMILTDEPTGNLDTKNGEEVLRLLCELNQTGRTIVVVTHNPEIAESIPRTIEIRDGRVVSDRVGSVS